MGKANETYSAIFDLFTYWGYSMEAESGKTLGEILKEALQSGNSSEVYYQILEDAIRRYPDLENAKLISPSWQQGGRYKSETHACVFELPNGDKYVAYRGTGDGGWIDNAQGMTQESTLMQREAAQYFDQVAEEQGWTEADNVYVTGHSKGGNKAQYVTLMSNHANLIDECHSLDGQGFSEEAIQSFKEKYGEEEYQKRLQKMYGYNGSNDYVNPLGHTIIPKENITYVNTVPNTDSKFAGLHMEEMMFQQDENGNTIAVLGEETEQGVMGELAAFLSDFLNELPEGERQAASMVVMQVMEMGDIFDGGGGIGIDGTTLTLEEARVFLKQVLPKLMKELDEELEKLGLDEELKKLGIDKEFASQMILIIGAILAIILEATQVAKECFESLKQHLSDLGSKYEGAIRVLERIINWIKDKSEQIAQWFKKQTQNSNSGYFYVETEQLLHFKEEIEHKKTKLEESADKIRELRKRVNFGNLTQQNLYFSITSSARNLEKEAKELGRLSKGLQNCVKIYKQNEQKVIGIYSKA